MEALRRGPDGEKAGAGGKSDFMQAFAAFNLASSATAKADGILISSDITVDSYLPVSCSTSASLKGGQLCIDREAIGFC